MVSPLQQQKSTTDVKAAKLSVSKQIYNLHFDEERPGACRPRGEFDLQGGKDVKVISHIPYCTRIPHESRVVGLKSMAFAILLIFYTDVCIFRECGKKECELWVRKNMRKDEQKRERTSNRSIQEQTNKQKG